MSKKILKLTNGSITVIDDTWISGDDIAVYLDLQVSGVVSNARGKVHRDPALEDEFRLGERGLSPKGRTQETCFVTLAGFDRLNFTSRQEKQKELKMELRLHLEPGSVSSKYTRDTEALQQEVEALQQEVEALQQEVKNLSAESTSKDQVNQHLRDNINTVASQMRNFMLTNNTEVQKKSGAILSSVNLKQQDGLDLSLVAEKTPEDKAYSDAGHCAYPRFIQKILDEIEPFVDDLNEKDLGIYRKIYEWQISFGRITNQQLAALDRMRGLKQGVSRILMDRLVVAAAANSHAS